MSLKQENARLTEENIRLKEECSRLRDAFTQDIIISQPDSTEPKDVIHCAKDNHFRIYIVWAIGTYANGVKMLDLRAITTSLGLAKTYSKMMRRDKTRGERFERIAIEPRVANHLYGEEWREMMVNTGKM